MALPRPARPAALLADLRSFVTGEEHRHRLLFLTIAIGMTSLIITGFILESRWGVMPGRHIVMVSDWHADRSDAEIVTQQKIDQKAAHEAREARRREWEKADKALKGLGI